MITIIGAGRTGSVIGQQIVTRELGDLTLIDIIKGLPQGEALDLGHMAAEQGVDVEIRGSNEYRDMEGSDLVIVTAGLPRKPGMTRLDLLQKNSEIAKDIAAKIAEYAPRSKILWFSNPVDVLTYIALKVTGFERGRVFGQGGMLDISRFKYCIAQATGVSRASIQGLVIGEHGDSMVPLTRFSTINGLPLTEILTEQQLKEIVDTTRKVAIEVIALKGATIYAPAQGVARMVEAVVRDKKAVLPVSAYLDGEYGVKDLCIGVPVVLGGNGVEKIIELKLSEDEKAKFMEGAQKLKDAIASLKL